MAALALIVHYVLVLRGSRKAGLEPARSGRVFLTATILGLGAAAAGGTGFSLVVSGLIATAFAGYMAWREGSWKLLDVLAMPIPLSLGLARLGCFLAHDHIGRPTTSWLGVQFPTGPAFDLGLLQAIGAFVVAGLLWPVGRGAGVPDGFRFALVIGGIAVSRLLVLPFGFASRTDWLVSGLIFASAVALSAKRSLHDPEH